MQQEIFSHDDKFTKHNKSLVQINKGKTVISKEQQAFNKLTTRIKTLQEKIKKNNEVLFLLNTRYQEKVTPEIIRLGQEKIRLSHLLHEKRKTEKLSGHLNSKLDELICQLLDDAFSVITPDKQTADLFEKYSGASYEEEMNAQKEDMAEMFSSVFYEQTGIKIDPEDLKTGNPDFDKLNEQIKEQLHNKEQSQPKKNKKQLAKEKLEKQKEEVKNKSLRGIYFSLAKILHPDLEPDEKLRQEKEEYMKRVTVAYDNKNLMELLQLEIIWVTAHETSLQNTPVETLKIFIQLLKDQVKDLEHESMMVMNNPAYANVYVYLNEPISTAFANIDFKRQAYITTHTEFSDAISALEKGNRNRSVIVTCIDNFYDDHIIDDDGNFDEEDFFNFLSENFNPPTHKKTKN